MHRTRWSFWESLPQPLPKGKGFGAALTGIFFWESKKQRGKETGSQRDKESKRRRVKESKRRRDGESKSQRDGEMKSRRRGCLMGLNRVCSMVVQWLFNGCSMVVQWLFNGWCCFSWKAWQIFATAWQIFATAWQKIRMPCAHECRGSVLHSFELIISCIFKQVSSGWRRKR